MTTPFIERTDSRRRVGPLTIVGIILVPLVVAGLLIWALWSPSDRLHTVKAAIVNNDEPVKIDGQTVPLGRQLGAGLVEGGTGDDDDTAMNYDWVVTDSADAAAGLTDGSYAAVVTIPENFSEAATSYSGDPEDAEQALIDVTTSPSGRLLDGAISQAVTTTAASVLGTTLTSTYLDNIYLGFNTLHDQLGDAADGAAQLADGTGQLADGTAQAADGASRLAENADQLVSGAKGLADGASGFADGASKLADGASQAADGAGQVAGGASALATGLQSLVGGLDELAGKTAQLPAQTRALADGAAGVSAGVSGVSSTITDTMAPLAEACTAGDQESCARLAGAVTATADADTDNDGVADLTALADGAKSLASGTDALAGGMSELSSGIAAIADGASSSQSGASDLADGAAAMSDGVGQLAGGASQLSSGASRLSTGAAQYVDGIRTYTGGVTSLSDALAQLSDGMSGVDDGATELSDGLATAVEQIPSYSTSERSSLSDVVADPVSTSGEKEDALDFGTGGLPLYAVIALWVGTFAVYLLLRAVPLRTLGSTRSPLALTLRSAAPGLALGALQGLLVSIVLGVAQGHTFGQWLGTAAVAILIGAAFAAVNQALVAVLGGTGRFVAMVVAIVALATGIVSTVPGFLDRLFGMLPVSPAKTALETAILGTGGLGPALVGLFAWLLGALAVTAVSIALRRTVSARRLAAAPA